MTDDKSQQTQDPELNPNRTKAEPEQMPPKESIIVDPYLQAMQSILDIPALENKREELKKKMKALGRLLSEFVSTEVTLRDPLAALKDEEIFDNKADPIKNSNAGKLAENFKTLNIQERLNLRVHRGLCNQLYQYSSHFIVEFKRIFEDLPHQDGLAKLDQVFKLLDGITDRSLPDSAGYMMPSYLEIFERYSAFYDTNADLLMKVNQPKVDPVTKKSIGINLNFKVDTQPNTTASLDFGAISIQPVQRFPRYKLLLNEIMKQYSTYDSNENTWKFDLVASAKVDADQHNADSAPQVIINNDETITPTAADSLMTMFEHSMVTLQKISDGGKKINAAENNIKRLIINDNHAHFFDKKPELLYINFGSDLGHPDLKNLLRVLIHQIEKPNQKKGSDKAALVKHYVNLSEALDRQVQIDRLCILPEPHSEAVQANLTELHKKTNVHMAAVDRSIEFAHKLLTASYTKQEARRHDKSDFSGDLGATVKSLESLTAQVGKPIAKTNIDLKGLGSLWKLNSYYSLLKPKPSLPTNVTAAQLTNAMRHIQKLDGLVMQAEIQHSLAPQSTDAMSRLRELKDKLDNLQYRKQFEVYKTWLDSLSDLPLDSLHFNDKAVFTDKQLDAKLQQAILAHNLIMARSEAVDLMPRLLNNDYTFLSTELAARLAALPLAQNEHSDLANSEASLSEFDTDHDSLEESSSEFQDEVSHSSSPSEQSPDHEAANVDDPLIFTENALINSAPTTPIPPRRPLPPIPLPIYQTSPELDPTHIENPAVALALDTAQSAHVLESLKPVPPPRPNRLANQPSGSALEPVAPVPPPVPTLDETPPSKPARPPRPPSPERPLAPENFQSESLQGVDPQQDSNQMTKISAQSDPTPTTELPLPEADNSPTLPMSAALDSAPLEEAHQDSLPESVDEISSTVQDNFLSTIEIPKNSQQAYAHLSVEVPHNARSDIEIIKDTSLSQTNSKSAFETHTPSALSDSDMPEATPTADDPVKKKESIPDTDEAAESQQAVLRSLMKDNSSHDSQTDDLASSNKDDKHTSALDFLAEVESKATTKAARIKKINQSDTSSLERQAIGADEPQDERKAIADPSEDKPNASQLDTSDTANKRGMDQTRTGDHLTFTGQAGNTIDVNADADNNELSKPSNVTKTPPPLPNRAGAVRSSSPPPLPAGAGSARINSPPPRPDRPNPMQSQQGEPSNTPHSPGVGPGANPQADAGNSEPSSGAASASSQTNAPPPPTRAGVQKVTNVNSKPPAVPEHYKRQNAPAALDDGQADGQSSIKQRAKNLQNALGGAKGNTHHDATGSNKPFTSTGAAIPTKTSNSDANTPPPTQSNSHGVPPAPPLAPPTDARPSASASAGSRPIPPPPPLPSSKTAQANTSGSPPAVHPARPGSPSTLPGGTQPPTLPFSQGHSFPGLDNSYDSDSDDDFSHFAGSDNSYDSDLDDDFSHFAGSDNAYDSDLDDDFSTSSGDRLNPNSGQSLPLGGRASPPPFPPRTPPRAPAGRHTSTPSPSGLTQFRNQYSAIGRPIGQGQTTRAPNTGIQNRAHGTYSDSSITLSALGRSFGRRVVVNGTQHLSGQAPQSEASKGASAGHHNAGFHTESIINLEDIKAFYDHRKVAYEALTRSEGIQLTERQVDIEQLAGEITIKSAPMSDRRSRVDSMFETMRELGEALLEKNPKERMSCEIDGFSDYETQRLMIYFLSNKNLPENIIPNLSVASREALTTSKHSAEFLELIAEFDAKFTSQLIPPHERPTVG